MVSIGCYSIGHCVQLECFPTKAPFLQTPSPTPEHSSEWDHLSLPTMCAQKLCLNLFVRIQGRAEHGAVITNSLQAWDAIANGHA